MLDLEPIFLPAAAWKALGDALAADDATVDRLGLRCPFSGQVEEYLLLDRLGGMRNIWPERLRASVEAAAE